MHCLNARLERATKTSVIAALLLVVAWRSNTGTAQVGRNTNLWKWTQEADHLKSVVQVSLDGSHGTGVVVRVDSNRPKMDGVESHILTAYHVVEPDKGRDAIRVTYRDGTVANKCRLVDFDDQRDIALLASWAQNGVRPAKTSTVRVQRKMYLEFAGLGGTSNSTKLRHFSSKATQPTNADFIYADATLLPGDSGGPVFNKRRELVGIISGGWFWWDGGVTTEDGTPLLPTWPARASNVDAIHKMLSRFSEADIARR